MKRKNMILFIIILLTISQPVNAVENKEIDIIFKDIADNMVDSILDRLEDYEENKKINKDIEVIGLNFEENINFELLEEGIKIRGKSKNYLWGSGGDKKEDNFRKILYRYNENSQTWEQIYIFDKRIKAIHFNSKDEMFVSIGNSRWGEDIDAELYKSKDLGKSFKKVLDIKSGVALEWNIDSDNKGNMYISEYGNKDMKDNPRRIYKSEDWGENWDIVYKPKEQEGYHCHVIHIDKNNSDNIYQVIGDDDKHILKSEDKGKTWKRIIEDTHPTSVVQIDDRLIFGLDGYPFAGFKTLDTSKDEMIYDYKLEKPYKGSIYNMLRTDDIIYAAVSTYYYHDWPAGVFYSMDDGQNWELLFRWDKTEDLGVGLYDLVDKGDYIYMAVGVPVKEYGKERWFEGTIRFEKLKLIEMMEKELIEEYKGIY